MKSFSRGKLKEFKNQGICKLRRCALVLLSIFFLIYPSMTNAIEYSGFGGRPAFPREDNPRTDSIFVHTAEPGQQIEEGILVVNNTDKIKTLYVYGTDSTPSSGGGFACKQLLDEQRVVGTWLELEKTEVTLEPDTNEKILFQIKVPDNIGGGEYNGCICIQEKKEDNGEKKAGMNLSVRTGLRVAITVPGDLRRELKVTGFAVDKREDKSFLYKAKIANLGDVSIDADVNITTRNLFGLKKMKYGGEYNILGGESSEYNFEMKRPFWGGIYRSSIALAYNNDADTELGKENGSRDEKIKGPSIMFFSMPTLFAGLIELCLLAAIISMVAMLVLAKKRKQWVMETWSDHEIPRKTDVKTLANKHNVSWKILAKVNKIKPPYILTKGTIIKVPPEEE